MVQYVRLLIIWIPKYTARKKQDQSHLPGVWEGNIPLLYRCIRHLLDSVQCGRNDTRNCISRLFRACHTGSVWTSLVKRPVHHCGISRLWWFSDKHQLGCTVPGCSLLLTVGTEASTRLACWRPFYRVLVELLLFLAAQRTNGLAAWLLPHYRPTPGGYWCDAACVDGLLEPTPAVTGWEAGQQSITGHSHPSLKKLY